MININTVSLNELKSLSNHTDVDIHYITDPFYVFGKGIQSRRVVRLSVYNSEFPGSINGYSLYLMAENNITPIACLYSNIYSTYRYGHNYLIYGPKNLIKILRGRNYYFR